MLNDRDLVSLACQSLGLKTVRAGRRAAKAAWDAVAVEVGLRPGFLYDRSLVEPKDLLTFLEQLRGSGLLHGPSPVVLDLQGHLIVANPSVTLTHLSEGRWVLVDASPTLAEPQIAKADAVAESLRISQTLAAAIVAAPAAGPVLLRPESKGWNLATAFGLLLGFPVVYWSEAKAGREGDTCLASPCPVRVYRASARCPKRPDGSAALHDICSFSIPSVVASSTASTLARWQTTLHLDFAKQRCFEHLNVTSEMTLLPSGGL
uniref:UPF0739 protein C1orf74 homolog n=1 Tax=Myxine glutinosa TaxID=7769 RepID=UPI00358FBBF3